MDTTQACLHSKSGQYIGVQLIPHGTLREDMDAESHHQVRSNTAHRPCWIINLEPKTTDLTASQIFDTTVRKAVRLRI